ncbi:hypothetical protein LTR10_019947 [Elasticomyces elasticus]|uniref:Telomere replication protein EST3 n=1 Tax=Exophiala sideris TaxID=1016849 RepID=A0ABR0J9L3_9EURO|nr:hypothetical protein LTR10_019947 [Elasticomyces elasticus]KAK5022783.1 hypothetical protein LTS07_009761 [Exophiala sideris]KAK5026685.1 hypothetical protein LTR13_009909 [Exophiala sideris]KAK5059410.1 hypothetical protein LTR69_005999 [Exophiala sideris]KAK5177445.1 hypothetical protein LTR44_010061 [Eurotiomycetes sp. CCFEE 6388]
MEHHEPWLADFIVLGLTEYIRKLRYGQPLLEYKSKSNGGESIQLWRGAHFERTVRVIIQEQPLKGVLSDGRHSIETVFGKVVEAQLIASGVQVSELTSPFFALRVTEPTIIVNGAYGKPKLRLLAVDCQVERTVKVQGTMPLAEGSSASEDKVIKEKVLELLQLNPEERRVSSMPSASPQSVKSQVAYDHDNPSDSEDDVRQERFLTQVDQSSSYHPAPKPASINARVAPTETHGNNELLAQLQRRDIPQIPAETTTVRKKSSIPARSSHANSESHKQVANDDIAPTVPGSIGPSLHEENAAEGPPAQSARHGDQSDRRESETTDSSVVNDGDPSAKTIPELKPTMSARDESIIAPPLPTGLIRHFARWRQEARSGRYVPRYVQKIPEDQATLLESEDSWQPPLVGHPSRPGQVALPLLERLCQAADQKASNMEEVENIPDSRSTEPELPAVASANELRSSLIDVESDSEASEASWSASPPTQERRGRILPADSPPLVPRQTKRPIPRLVNTLDQREDTTQQQSASSDSLHASYPGAAAQKDSHEGRPREVVSSAKGTHETSNTQSTEESSNPCADPLTSSAELTSDKEKGTKLSQSSSQTLKEHSNSAGNGVQVERTPHVPKGNWDRASSDLVGIIDNADLPLSCIPATHYENTNKHSKKLRAAEMPQPSLSSENEKQCPRTRGRMPTNGVEAANSPPDAQTALLHVPRRVVPSATPTKADTVGSEGPEEESHEATQAISETRLPASSHESQNAHVPIEYGFVPVEDVATKTQPSRGALLGSSHFQQTGPHRPVDYGLVAAEEAATDQMAQAQAGSMLEEVVASSQAVVERGSRPILAGKRTHADQAFSPTKRRRKTLPTTSERAFDPAYASVYRSIEESRRAQLSRIAKPKSLSGQSASSSVKDPGNAGDALRMSSSPAMRSQPPVTADVSPRASTPITRASVYADIDGHEGKVRPSDSISQTLAPLLIDLPPVFEQFQAAYPDYNGDLDDFANSCRLLGHLLRRGQAPHQFLLDDAIYHHLDSYRRYLAEEGAYGPDRPMSFHEYYAQRVEIPTHLKSIVTLKMFQDPSSRSNSEASRRISGRAARNTSFADIPTLLSRKEVSVGEKFTTTLEVNREKANNEKNLSQSDEAVEQWRHEVSCPASPELGTPDVDRSRSDISMTDCDVLDPNVPKPAPRTSDPRPPEKKGTVSVRPTSAAMAPPMTKPSTAAHFKMPAKTSTSRKSALNGPSAPGVLSQSPAVKKFTKWWVDPDTPFNRYANHYASLPQEKLTRNKVQQTKGTINPGGIDIFSWRT